MNQYYSIRFWIRRQLNKIDDIYRRVRCRLFDYHDWRGSLHCRVCGRSVWL
jgi:hypothetical protein